MHAVDYPSHLRGGSPPTPMLLDTCVLQHLKRVMDLMEEDWMWRPGSLSFLRARFGIRFAAELITLGEAVQLLRLNGPPWVVSMTSWVELAAWRGERARDFRSWWVEWAEYAEASSMDGAHSRLSDRLPAHAAPGQLDLGLDESPREVTPMAIPQALPFKDAGDRALIGDALRFGTPGILTLDLRSFWTRRHLLYPLGLEVWRPTDLWESIRPDGYSPQLQAF